MGAFRSRPDGGSYGVAFLEEDVNDVDGGEAIRTGDENFASWRDDWHTFLFFEFGVSESEMGEFGDLRKVGTRGDDPFYLR